MVGETGFEPATPWSRRDSGGVRTGSQGLTPSLKSSQVQGDSAIARSHGFTPVLPILTPFTTRLLPSGIEPRRLLTVREVASVLSVSAATIYKLIATRTLPHVRIGNAIRVPAEDFARVLNRPAPQRLRPA